MKAGVLTFGYDHFAKLELQSRSAGFYTTNLGDNMQSLAMRYIFAGLGIAEDRMVSVNRDAIPEYSGEEVALLMNGCFYDHCFPIPSAITPVFIGFQASEEVIRNNREELSRHAPIGCRDTRTTALLRRYGVAAFTTGCVTLTLPHRPESSTADKVFLVYGSGPGAFPSAALAHMPPHLLSRIEFVCQRLVVTGHPRTEAQIAEAEIYARHLFQSYSEQARLVVTSLHHAATPCIAAGIPVVICRERPNSRFSLLASLLPIYGPDRFHEIDWDRAPLDIRDLKARLLRQLKTKLLPLIA
jgi:hypothetical protein